MTSLISLLRHLYLQPITNIAILEAKGRAMICGSVVEHPLRDREVVGSNPGRAIPKALKMVPVATLLVAQHYKASTGFSSPNKHRTTSS